MRLPVPLPTIDHGTGELHDGFVVAAPSFCRDRWAFPDKRCIAHYERLSATLSHGPVQCPYGFTTQRVGLRSGNQFICGVVAAPRFGDSQERDRAKKFPSSRVSRDALVHQADAMIAMDIELQRLESEARRRLPQALHELRKLNAIVKQAAEKIAANYQIQDAEKVAGAAQLMSNIFEVVEVLTNIEDIAPSVAQRLEFVSVFDLAYKAKKIYQIRAELRPISISVDGDDKVGIRGSKKYFPLVVQVLLENAIKYGEKGSNIKVHVSRDGLDCVLTVSNKSIQAFDPQACFDRGVRFADPSIEGDGLGLYLAREVVKAHGGTIRADYAEGTARFVVKIPAAREERK